MAELRFGIAPPGGTPGARYWTLRSAAKRPDLYLIGNRTGAIVHLSFHESAMHWHAQAVEQGERKTLARWERPRELAPGLTRCVELVSTPVVATRGAPTRKQGVVWYEPKDRDLMVRFDVFLEAQGMNQATWPGKSSMGTTFIGRVTMSDGGTACVVAHEIGTDLTTRFPEVEGRAMFARMATTPDPWLYLVSGDQDDGHIVVSDLPIDPAAAAAIANATPPAP